MTAEKRLLIVDDELDIREFLQLQTEHLARHITLAANGVEALEAIQKNTFDAVLTDINMPLMTGLEFLAAIRAQGIETPVVILTSIGDKKLAVEALKLGAFDFLDKPWMQENLVEVLGRALELGAEMNYWKAETSVRESLQQIKSENSAQSAAFLERVLSLMTRERQSLRRNLKS